MGSCLSAESSSPRPGSPGSTAVRLRERKNSKKKLGLHRIPGRMFLNGYSEVAALFTQQGKKGINQDAMIVWENFVSRTDTVFCGVFDGHGPFGHMVARRVRDSLPLKLCAPWEVNRTNEDSHRESNLNMGSMNSEDSTFISADEESRPSLDSEETDMRPEIFQTLKDSFLKAFKMMDRELRMHSSIDCFCSGTTAVTLIKQGRDLVIGNVGDSRAVLGTRDEDDSLIAVQLTVDLKPNLPVEAERIRKCKGRVFALEAEPEVARVWLPNSNFPGLAMARAFGDFCLKDFGIISVPEISHRRLTDKDEFIVLATDGIWDVLSNKEVVDIVASAPSRPRAAQGLVVSAVKAWKCKYPTSKIDDCAVVCLFLDSNSNNSSSASFTKLKEQLSSVDPSNPAVEKDYIAGPIGLIPSGTATSVREVPPEAWESNSEVGKEWSALDGVTRVNTLVSLPRFRPGEEEKKAR